MSDKDLKPILKQFLLSITGNDIMRTNNDDYGCVDRFLNSERYQNALNEANDARTNTDEALSIGGVSGMLPKEQNDKEWELLKKELNTNNWNAGEETTFYGFFLHGWLGRLKQGCWQ